MGVDDFNSLSLSICRSFLPTNGTFPFVVFVFLVVDFLFTQRSYLNISLRNIYLYDCTGSLFGTWDLQCGVWALGCRAGFSSCVM